MAKFRLGKTLKKSTLLTMIIIYWKHRVGNFLRTNLLKFPKLSTLAKKEKRKKNIFLLHYVLRIMEGRHEWK